MSEAHIDLNELKTFVAELKADRAASKAKEQREAWTKYTSLSLVFVAVLAAIATQWAGKYSSRVLVKLNDSTFKQAQASDQWSYYQAKSIKQNLYEVAKEQVALAAASGSDTTGLQKKIQKYEADKKEIYDKAKELEAERDTARAAAAVNSIKGGNMGLAISIFQIAIAMSSICLVTKKKPLWYLSIVLAVGATAEMVAVWLT